MIKRGFFRSIFVVLLPFLITAIFLTSAIYGFESVSRRMAIHLSGMIGTLPSFQALRIIPFSGFRLENIRLQRAGQWIGADDVLLVLSPDGIWTGQWSCTKLRINGLRIEGQGAPDQWGQTLVDEFTKTIADAESAIPLDLDELLVEIDGADFPSPFESYRVRLTRATVRRQGGRLSCTGRVRLVGQSYKSTAQPAPGFFSEAKAFTVHLEVLQQGIVLNQFRFLSPQLKLNAAGQISMTGQTPVCSIRFHSDPVSIRAFPVNGRTEALDGNITLLGHVHGPLSQLTMETEAVLPSATFLVDDIPLQINHFRANGDLYPQQHRFRLKDLQFTVGKTIHVRANGLIVHKGRGTDVRFNTLVRLDGGQQPSPVMISEMIMRLQGQIRKGGFNGRMDLALNRPTRQYRFDLGAVEMNFVPDAEGARINLEAGRLDYKEILIGAGQTEQVDALSFQDTALSLTVRGRRSDLNRFWLRGYGGSISAKGFYYQGADFPEYKLETVLDKLDFRAKKINYPIPCVLSGQVSGHLQLFSNQKGGRHMQGIIAAEQFGLRRMEALDKVAEFLGLPQLKEIKDAQVFVQFETSPESSLIRRLDLDSPNVILRSTFNVNAQNWQEGIIALSLPQGMLRESPVIKKLMAIAREREQWLDFVVRLSGYEDNLRVELVKSTLRDKLKDRVSPRIQSIIVDIVNEAMNL